MINTIQFESLSAILLDFVDQRDGFLYLRLVGAETAVNAIWAKLAARESRGKKWGSAVTIPLPGQAYPQYVAAQKQVTYRTLRSRLPSGMIDLALVHPNLTAAEDSERGLYLLTYEEDLPTGFFERLNKSLSIPLKSDWAEWLWEAGQRPHSFLTLQTSKVREGREFVEKTTLTEVTETPIQPLDSLGEVACYQIRCDGHARDAWLHLIREQLGLGIRLQPGADGYHHDPWTITQSGDEWRLNRAGESVLQAPSLNHLLTEARQMMGLHFLIERR